MRTEIILIFFGMMVVTYLPRVAPFLLINFERLPESFKRFLRLIPVTALGALILPGLIMDIKPFPISGAAGVFVAFIYAIWRGGIVVPVLLSVLTTFLLGQANL